MNTAVTVTIAIFMIGVIFQAGRLSVRVEKLEEWRLELMTELKGIRSALRKIENAVASAER